MKVQPQYLVQTGTKKELPAPPSGDSWHNPEGIAVERIPEGMRLLSMKEIQYNREHTVKQGFYRYFDEFSEISDNWNGNAYEYTYFTDAPYPLWERPQFLGDEFNDDKFYGTSNAIGEKGLIIDTGLHLEKYRVYCLKDGFTAGNYYWRSGSLREIKEIFRVYEFDSFLELAKWAENKVD
jgi:hypothetical protein